MRMNSMKIHPKMRKKLAGKQMTLEDEMRRIKIRPTNEKKRMKTTGMQKILEDEMRRK